MSSDAPPPFLSKTYEIVDDPENQSIIGWAPDGRSFVVWDKLEFERDVLPRHFKHNNFSSFVRQLNTYGFRKVDSTRLEWANDYFRRGHRELLKDMQRQGTRKRVGNERGGRSASPGGPEARGALALPASRGTLIELSNPPPLPMPGAGPGAGGSEAQNTATAAAAAAHVMSLARDRDLLKEEVKRLRSQQEAMNRQMQDMSSRQNRSEQTLQRVMLMLQQVSGGSGGLGHLLMAYQQRPLLTDGTTSVPMSDMDEEDGMGGAGVAGGSGRKRRKPGASLVPPMLPSHMGPAAAAAAAAPQITQGFAHNMEIEELDDDPSPGPRVADPDDDLLMPSMAGMSLHNGALALPPLASPSTLAAQGRPRGGFQPGPASTAVTSGPGAGGWVAGRGPLLHHHASASSGGPSTSYHPSSSSLPPPPPIPAHLLPQAPISNPVVTVPGETPSNSSGGVTVDLGGDPYVPVPVPPPGAASHMLPPLIDDLFGGDDEEADAFLKGLMSGSPLPMHAEAAGGF